MKTKKQFLLLVLSFITLSSQDVWAQRSSSIYIEAGVGTQIMFAKNGSDLSFGRRLTPSFSLTGGKWFNPFWGARLQFQGISYNMYTDNTGSFKNGAGEWTNIDPVRDHVTVNPDGTYHRNVRYFNTIVGLQASVINVFAGYDPARSWDIIPGIGVGLAHVFEYKGMPKSNTVNPNFSILGKWFFNSKFDFNAELATTRYPDKFDSRLTSDKAEWGLSLTVGATYYFSNNVFNKHDKLFKCCHRKHKQPQTTQYVYPTQMNTQPVAPNNVSVQQVQVEKKVYPKPFVLSTFLFDLNKDKFSDDQLLQIRNIANYLSANPNSMVRLDSYGDRETGTSEANQEISLRRALYVSNILMKDYGIDRSRILITPLGSSEQPFEINEWNRAVLATIVQKPE